MSDHESESDGENRLEFLDEDRYREGDKSDSEEGLGKKECSYHSREKWYCKKRSDLTSWEDHATEFVSGEKCDEKKSE